MSNFKEAHAKFGDTLVMAVFEFFSITAMEELKPEHQDSFVRNLEWLEQVRDKISLAVINGEDADQYEQDLLEAVESGFELYCQVFDGCAYSKI